MLHPADWILIALYFLALIVVSFFRIGKSNTEESFLLSGRTLTLPAFVATLVSTWYGDILGIGEYTFLFGISQWIVFGLPYYLFAVLFAVFLAGKIRENRALTLPEALANAYSPRAGIAGAVLVFLLVNPAPYLFMAGLLFRFVLGSEASILLFAALTALFSVLYVAVSGFRAVVRTDAIQVVLMYIGFAVLLWFAAAEAGSPTTLWKALPEPHTSLLGGQPITYLLVWFFIALWTFVDPGFHQRAAAAKTPQTARKGIFLSVAFWLVFDIMTLFTGLYAVVIIGSTDHAALIYPELAMRLLPVGLTGLFFLTLLATIMSTLDSFLLLSGQTLGRDLIGRLRGEGSSVATTRLGLVLSALLALILIAVYPSVVSLWYVIGSVLLPGLLIPVLGIYIAAFRLPTRLILPALVLPTCVSALWLVLGTITAEDLFSYAFLGVEPFYPGLLTSLLLWGVGRLRGAITFRS